LPAHAAIRFGSLLGVWPQIGCPRADQNLANITEVSFEDQALAGDGGQPGYPGWPPGLAAALLLDVLAEIFDRFADLPLRLAVAFLYVAFGLVGEALIVQTLVVRQVTHTLFHFTLQLFGFAFQFVTIHEFALLLTMRSRIETSAIKELPEASRQLPGPLSTNEELVAGSWLIE
jgi:hypothetical protein